MANPIAVFTTNLGEFAVELYADKSPKTVENFVSYLKAGFYDGTIFHRVIPGFMVQGGGFTPGMDQKKNGAPIQNEADNGVTNARGTIAMARTNDPHSATSQFFINVVDNKRLDYRSKDSGGWGYCAFGAVVRGMETVDAIAAVKTGNRFPHQDVPKDDVVVIAAKLEA